jgi:phosphatidylserine decarboxylase
MDPSPNPRRGATLLVQLGILLACGSVLWPLVRSFPYPSPLVRGLLPPEKRWPTEQVREWIAAGNVDPGFLSFFLRDPEREIAPGPVAVAAADGLLREVRVRDGKVWFVILLSFWDVHVQRSPLAGTVRSVEDRGDTYMDKEWRDMVFLNEKLAPVQKVITLDTEVGEVFVHLITSVAARRLEAFVQPGQTIEKGQRIGSILLGSTVVVALPESCVPVARADQRVVGGETVLARLPEKVR